MPRHRSRRAEIEQPNVGLPTVRFEMRSRTVKASKMSVRRDLRLLHPLHAHQILDGKRALSERRCDRPREHQQAERAARECAKGRIIGYSPRRALDIIWRRFPGTRADGVQPVAVRQRRAAATVRSTSWRPNISSDPEIAQSLPAGAAKAGSRRPGPLASDAPAEITLRGLVIGVLITLIFTAANVYFGLKAGITFSTSIPAAVISMAILRSLRGATSGKQHRADGRFVGRHLSSVIFVLPGFIIVGWWTGFPFWASFLICAAGGILGVMYTIPLRRALVTDSDLPYPEGVACAEVLKVGTDLERGSDSEAVESRGAALKAVVIGSIVSAVFFVIVQTRIFASDVAQYFRLGTRGAATGYDFSLSFALFAIGHLVGLCVGIAMLVGALIGWGWAVPHFTALHPLAGAAADVAQGAWDHSVRFVGAGAIGVASVWTLGTLVKPVIGGVAGALATARVRKAGQAHTLPTVERDIPIGTVGLVSLLCLLPVAWLFWDFSTSSGLGTHALGLTLEAVVFVAIMGFVVSTVCGYMAGLIGASNSPLSGVGILVVVVFALLLVIGVKSGLPPGAGKALVAFALFVTAVIFAVASIANNNLQDLKTGQLVGATPSKQQWALVIGVIGAPPSSLRCSTCSIMRMAFWAHRAPTRRGRYRRHRPD